MGDATRLRHQWWWRGAPILAVIVAVAVVVGLLVAVSATSSPPQVEVAQQSDSAENAEQTDHHLDGSPSPSPEGSPSPSPAETAEGMQIDPERARPGEVVALTFPQHEGVENTEQTEDRRTFQFMLQADMAEGWKDVAYLFSDVYGDDPRHILMEDVPENFSITMQAVLGPGPDHVRLPESIEPGQYRICELPGVSNCAPIKIR